MNTISKITFNAAVFLLCLSLAPSCSNNNNDSKESKEVAEEVNEEKFDREGEKDADRLNEAYVTSLYEVKASEQAVTRATTAEVKKLAEMMVQAHTKMNTEIQGLAGRKNITLATDITDELNRKMEKLNEKNGLDYDKEYTEQMRERHQEGIKLTERAADKGEDAEIKQWASASTPQLRAHLDMIESTHNMIKDMKDNEKDRNKTRNNVSGDDHSMHDGKSHTTSH
jgi:putative membrane protein